MRTFLTTILLIAVGGFAALPQTNTFCAANLACTVTGAWTFSGGITVNTSALALPTTTSASNGVITFGGVPFIHDFGTADTFVGSGAGNFTLSGVSNSGFGFQALQSLTSGNSNNAFGSGALAANTSGGGNAAFGDGVLAVNTTGQSNAAFGHFALNANTTGQGSSAFGTLALSSLVGGTNTNNSAFGIAAMQNLTTGTNNTGFGADALLNLKTGSNNMAFGVSPGAGPGAAYTSSESNNIVIGNIGVVGESGAIHLGTPGTQTQTYLIIPIATGSVPTLTGTGACLTANITTQKGGAWAGSAVCTNTTGASTLIITPGTTAPNGWSCWANDLTTAANILRQSATAAASCTIAGTVNANDVLTFGAIAY